MRNLILPAAIRNRRDIGDASHRNAQSADIPVTDADRTGGSPVVAVECRRNPEELKLETPGLHEEPHRLIALIRTCRHSTPHTTAGREAYQQAQAIVDRHLKNPLKKLAFAFVLRQARRAIVSRENMRFARSRLYGIVRRVFGRMAELFVEGGLIDTHSDLYYLTVDEIFGMVQGTSVTHDLKALIQIRKAEYRSFSRRDPGERLHTTGIPALDMHYKGAPGPVSEKHLRGTGCSGGLARGTARVVSEPRKPLGKGDHILITRSTDPGWIFLMMQAKGIVVERGSLLSHTAIIGRELGIPTVLAPRATQVIPDGACISIDGNTGEIRW